MAVSDGCNCTSLQVEWRDEVRHHFEKIKSEGTCLHRLDEELIKRRREELRFEKPHFWQQDHGNTLSPNELNAKTHAQR